MILDEIGDAYRSLRRLILEYLGMNMNAIDESAGSDGRHSVGSGSCKQGSRPGTGNKIYTKMQNVNETNPKGSVVSGKFEYIYESIMNGSNRN